MADAVLTLSVGIIIPQPQQLQGFAVDDVFDIPSIKSVETLMGVDGILSGGFVYTEIRQEIMLQADSLSNGLFDTWWTQMQATKSVYVASGGVRLPSIGTKFTMTNGFLTGYKPAPAGKRVLQPRRYELTWGRIAPSPT
jgi:hypothetical protein